jgi:hypothetical protein
MTTASTKIFLIVFFLTAALFACTSKKTPLLFELMPHTHTGIDFTNTVIDQKYENSFFYRNYYNGGGVAIADINNDGWCDVLLTSNMGENKLYLNKGNFVFEDITAKTGMQQDSMWSTGAVFADIDGDGWLDIYVCNAGHMKSGHRRNKLYINNHNLSFTESAAQYGLDVKAYTSHVSFFDYDLDGDLDCFMINNSPMPLNNLGYENRRNLPDAQWPVAEILKGGGDRLFQNNNGKFTEVTLAAGIHGSLLSFGLGVSVSDVNNDGWPDVYVANDSYERDYMYINQKNGTFKDEAEQCVEQMSFSSMGADIADINNDGYNDIFTTDMLPDNDYRLKTLGAFDNIDLYNKRIEVGLYRQFMKNCLFVNNKNGTFTESANYSGVAASDWSWGALFFDADNDGLNDIFVCNGINHDVTDLDFMDFFANDVIQKMALSGHKESVDSVLMHIPITPIPNKAFKNNGNLSFTDVTHSWGFSTPTFSNGAAYADLDNDGDLDLVINNENQPAQVYRNHAASQLKHNYIGVQLRGTGANTFAIGAKILLYKNGEIFSRENIPSRGFQSSVDYIQLIGLGQHTAIDSMIIIWPNTTYSKFINPVLNKVHPIQQPASGLPQYHFNIDNRSKPLFELQPINLDKHIEDDFIDFYYERNLPQQLSKEGPALAIGDVNGDKLADIFVGGAKDQPGQLYLQTPSGGLQKKSIEVFKQHADFEDVAALFFDADKDGDLDLFVGAGGNNILPNQRQTQHRLYLNDGTGNYTISANAFPANNNNISVAISYDYDGDGDEDLFVGSRSVPYHYGTVPSSYLYQNDGNGHFTDVAPQLNKAIANAGMVTGAVWADVAGNTNKELIITGQWMYTKIFQYNPQLHTFDELQHTGLEQRLGWWQTINVADINADGKQDLLIGNIGENFYLRPDSTHPVKLWLNDFDGDGNTEHFLTRTIEGKDMPVFLKREITDQFPALKKQNLKHSDYAKKSIQDLFGNTIVAGSVQKNFNYCKSIIAFNKGNGQFEIQPLPYQAQLSSINTIEIADFNQDAKPDLIIGGNNFEFPPQFGRLDGSSGGLLLNNGTPVFDWLQTHTSGLNIKGVIRHIRLLHFSGQPAVIVIRNNNSPVCLKFNQPLKHL